VNVIQKHVSVRYRLCLVGIFFSSQVKFDSIHVRTVIIADGILGEDRMLFVFCASEF
jgi:hypothetical protein